MTEQTAVTLNWPYEGARSLDDLGEGQTVLESRNDKEARLAIVTTERKSLRLEFNDAANKVEWDLDPGSLRRQVLHHVVFIVDSGARIISAVVDGQLCEGGIERQHGYGRIERSKEFHADPKGESCLLIGPSMKGLVKVLRIYDRRLTTAEAIGHYREGF